MNMFDDDSNFIYILKMMGQKVKIGGKEEQVLISNYKDMIIDYKKIKAIVPFNTGDIIEYQNSKWLIIGEVSKRNTIYKATMQKASHVAKMYIDNILEEIPTIIEVGTQNIKEDRYMDIIAGSIKLTVQDNSITKKITYDNRIIIMGTPYKTIAFTSEHKGLRYIYFKKDLFNNVTDDIENEIADRWLHEERHTYSIEISDITVPIGTTSQLNVIVKDTITHTDNTTETVIVVNPELTYISNNLNVATIDAKGLITPIAEGTTTIMVTYKNVSELINITVVPASQPLTITGQTFIKWGLQAKYTATNNTGNITWSIINEDAKITKALATIVSQDNILSTCTVKANSNMEMGYCILKAIDADLKEATFRIQIKSLYY